MYEFEKLSAYDVGGLLTLKHFASLNLPLPLDEEN